MLPFWQEWQPVGIRVGVSELKFAWSVGMELYFVALAGTDVGKNLGKDAQVPPLSSDMRMLGPQSAQSVPRLQSE